MRFTPRKSSPRLPSFDYVGAYAYHIILTTQGRTKLFRDGRLVALCRELLAASAVRYSFEVLSYCFMPDHLHMLVLWAKESSLVRFVQHFKQATGHRRRVPWQRSYYDHVIGDEESISDVQRYIWSNPVSAGLVKDLADYPHSGPRHLMVEDRAEALSLRVPVANER